MSNEIENLADMNVDDLYQQLGLKKSYAEAALLKNGEPTDNATTVKNFRFDSPASASFIGDSVDKLKQIGKQFFNELSERAYGVVCGSETGSDSVKNLIGKGKDALIAGLAALLIAKLAIAAAIAAIVAAIIVKLFFDSGGKILCQNWKGTLPAAA